MSTLFKVEASRELATQLWREGNYDAAREALSPVAALGGIPRDVVLASSVLLNIIESDSGRPRAALRILEATEGLVTACRDDVLKGKWLNTAGVNYRRLRQYQRAQASFEYAVIHHEQGKAFDYAAQSRANIGNLFIDLNSPDIARGYFDEALLRCESPEIVAQVLESKARALLMEGQLDEAEECALRSASLLGGVNRPTLLDATYRTLGAVRFARVSSGSCTPAWGG